MEQSLLIVLFITLVTFILGAIWYSPLMFGKKWMQIMGMSHLTQEEIKKLQKTMLPFYLLQFVLTVVTTSTLAYLITITQAISGTMLAFLIWAGFVAPTSIANVVWGSTKRSFWCAQLAIMLSYQLITLLFASYMLCIK